MGIHKADKPFSKNLIKQDVKVTYKRTFPYHQLSLILENGRLVEVLVELKAPEV